MGKCKETAGVLFPHPCTREAVTNCGNCGLAICELHDREGRCIRCFRAETPTGDGLQEPTDPFLLATSYYPDYDTGGSSAPRLRSAMSGEADLGDEAFEGDFDGT